MYDHLPTQDENWIQNLRDYGEYRKEMWNDKHEPCGVWEWFYDAEKTIRKAVLTFDDDDYPVYMTCWYESGKIKEQGRYKDGFPRPEGWAIWSETGELLLGEKEESGWNPLDAGYVAFAIVYTFTTFLKWLTI